LSIYHTRGLIDVKWVAMENVTRSALTNASGQVVHVLNNTSTQFAARPSVMGISGLPVAAGVGLVPGLIMGIKERIIRMSEGCEGSVGYRKC
jgi:hypothetical protein